ncbi:MAG: 2-C-methyl-D-erythritol 4-phosphate cytidylyltransferase [Opitutales bacterium]
MKNSAVILAGGNSTRMRGTVKDKCLELLLGTPIIMHSVKAFVESGSIKEIVFVCKDDEQKENIKSLSAKYLEENGISFIFADGGKERYNSVYNGLLCTSEDIDIVFIHDSARPLVKKESIVELCEACKISKASVLANKVVDSIKQNMDYPSNVSCELKDLKREVLWAMQTPQVFDKELIINAYTHIIENNISITDDVSAASEIGAKITIVENLNMNTKITLPQDIALVEYIMKQNNE